MLAAAAEDRVQADWHAALALVGALLLAEQAAAPGGTFDCKNGMPQCHIVETACLCNAGQVSVKDVAYMQSDRHDSRNERLQCACHLQSAGGKARCARMAQHSGVEQCQRWLLVSGSRFMRPWMSAFESRSPDLQQSACQPA